MEVPARSRETRMTTRQQEFFKQQREFHAQRLSIKRLLHPRDLYEAKDRRKDQRIDRSKRSGCINVAGLPDASGGVRHGLVGQPDKVCLEVKRDYQQEARHLIPISLICYCTHARGVLFRKIKREDLVDNVDRKNPSEEIAVGHAEIASAILPDPLFADGGGGGIEAEIPRGHNE